MLLLGCDVHFWLPCKIPGVTRYVLWHINMYSGNTAQIHEAPSSNHVLQAQSHEAPSVSLYEYSFCNMETWNPRIMQKVKTKSFYRQPS